MLCKSCEKKMKDIPSNFDVFSFLQATPQYCENSACEEFGYVTMVGIKEVKDDLSKTDVTN